MPNLSKSINCKDLPINPDALYGTAESGTVVIEGFPCNLMKLERKDESTVEVELNGQRATFNLTDMNVRIVFHKDGLIFQNLGYYSYSRAIFNVPDHKLNQLEEAKKLLKSMGAVLS